MYVLTCICMCLCLFVNQISDNSWYRCLLTDSQQLVWITLSAIGTCTSNRMQLTMSVHNNMEIYTIHTKNTSHTHHWFGCVPSYYYSTKYTRGWYQCWTHTLSDQPFHIVILLFFYVTTRSILTYKTIDEWALSLRHHKQNKHAEFMGPMYIFNCQTRSAHFTNFCN